MDRISELDPRQQDIQIINAVVEDLRQGLSLLPTPRDPDPEKVAIARAVGIGPNPEVLRIIQENRRKSEQFEIRPGEI